MSKKEEKVVNISDLRPESDIDLKKTSDTIVDISPKIKMDDIEGHTKPKKEHPKSKIIDNNNKNLNDEIKRKFDPSIINNPRFAKYEGNGSEKSIVSFMTDKYSFDRREVNYISVIVFIISVIFYFIARSLGGAESPDNIYIAAFAESANYALATFYEPYRKLYVVVVFLLFYFIPLKRYTNLKVQIFYDGLTIPYEIIPTVEHRRKRVEWKYIYSIELGKTKEIPYVRLLGDRKQLLGELRLDVDDPKKMYEIIDTYAPADHPIRILFTNSKKV
jgi:hypothetical protein